jgi:hypothetical protein
VPIEKILSLPYLSASAEEGISTGNVKIIYIEVINPISVKESPIL